MPAIQTPRTHGYPTDAIAGKPAPTKPAQACGSGSCPRCKRRELTDTPPTSSQASQLQQSPRQLWARGLCPRCRRRELTDTPPTLSQASQLQQSPRQPVGAGLARDANAAHSRIPHRRYRRQACSNRARASCGSGSCPRYRRRELADTPPTLSQASLLQQGPRKL